MPSCLRNSPTIQSMTRWSRLSPPRCVSPLVDLHLDDALADFEDGDVERAAAEVVDGDGLVLLLVEPVRQRGRRRLVDDAQHFETGDLAGVLGRLALRVVEVRGNGDDGLRDRLPEVVFRGLLELLQHHRGDLGRRERLGLPLDLHRHAIAVVHDAKRHHLHFFRDFVEAPAHEALD